MKGTIVVTGASRGIGLAIAEKFAKEGYDLALIARSEKELKGIKKRFEELYKVIVYTYTCDISDYNIIKEIINDLTKRITNITALINNASVGHFGLMRNLDVNRWEETIKVNLLGTYYVTKELLPFFIQKRSGDIINISSGAGEEGYSFCSAYSASKFGLSGFTESLMKEVRSIGVRVSLLSLDTVQTEMSRKSGLKVNNWDTIMKDEDVANVVYFMKNLPDHVFLKETSLWNVNPDRI